MVTVRYPRPKLLLCVGMGPQAVRPSLAGEGGGPTGWAGAQERAVLVRRTSLISHGETHVSYLEENL